MNHPTPGNATHVRSARYGALWAQEGIPCDRDRVAFGARSRNFGAPKARGPVRSTETDRQFADLSIDNPVRMGADLCQIGSKST